MQDLRGIYDAAPNGQKPHLPLEVLTKNGSSLENGPLPGGPVPYGDTSLDERMSSELRPSDLVDSPRPMCKNHRIITIILGVCQNYRFTLINKPHY